MATQRENSRLVRLETKIDKIGEQLVGVVRMEEQVKSIFKRIEKIDEKQDHIEQRVKQVEDMSRAPVLLISSLERLFWIVVTAVVSFIVWKLR